MKNKTIQGLKSGLAGLILFTGTSTACAQDNGSEIPAGKTVAIEQTRSVSPTIKNISLETGWHSKYLGSYGFSITDTPVIQSSLNFSVDNVNFNLWSNYDPKQGLTELDPGMSTTFDTKYLKLTPQFNVFTFPSLNNTVDASIGLTLESKNLPLDLRLFEVQAFGEGSNEGRLYQFSMGKTIPLNFISDRLSANVSGTLTYNEHYFQKGTGFSVFATGVNATYDLGKGYSVNAGYRAQKSLEDNFGGFFKDDHCFDISLRKGF